EVSAKFHLQRRRGRRRTKPLQFGHDVVQERPPLLTLLVRERWRRLIVGALDQLAGGRDSDTTKYSLRLADVDLFRWKIDVGVKFSQLWSFDFFPAWSLQRQRDFGVPNIERIEKRLVMTQSGVINIERDLVDESECFSTVLVVKDAHVPRDQTAERIEGEMPNRSFDTAPMQFLHHSRAPLASETFAREIPAAGDRRGNHAEDRKPQNQTHQRMSHPRLSILCRLNSL